MKSRLEDPVALTKEIVHGHYQGDDSLWLSLLNKKSVWIGSGERVVVGGDAIREHFQAHTQWKACQIFREEYYALPVNTQSTAVVAQITSGNLNADEANITACDTFLYQLVGSKTRIMLIHSSHGLLRSLQPEQDGSIMWVPAYHLYRSLLSDAPEADRLVIPSGGRTFYIHPNIILYARSKNRRAELVCVDSVLRSDLTLAQMNALLPDNFYPIHRCYTVNLRFIAAIRRYKVTMVTGETLPVPEETYNQIKAELDRRIGGTSPPAPCSSAAPRRASASASPGRQKSRINCKRL